MKDYPYSSSSASTSATSHPSEGKGNAEVPDDATGMGGERARRILEKKAERLKQKGEIEDLTERLKEKVGSLKELEGGLYWIGTLIGRVKLLWSMVRDREFGMKNSSKFLISAGLLYFILPFDFAPDFIPGIGYIDDAVVLSTLWNMIAGELDRYMAFLKTSGRELSNLDILAFADAETHRAEHAQGEGGVHMPPAAVERM